MQTSISAFNTYTRSNQRRNRLQMANLSIPPVSGIYLIKNLKNGKFYIGQAQNLHKRRIQHFSKLRTNKHSNSHLQSAWNKYGEKAFKFIVLEYISIEQLDERESYFVTLYRERNLCYNMQGGGNSPRGRATSPETRQKLSNAIKGIKRLPFSEEHCRKMSVSAKKRSDVTRMKLNKHWIVISPDGIEFNIIGLQQFCQENNLNQSAMVAVARNKRPHHKGWKCRYA